MSYSSREKRENVEFFDQLEKSTIRGLVVVLSESLVTSNRNKKFFLFSSVQKVELKHLLNPKSFRPNFSFSLSVVRFHSVNENIKCFCFRLSCGSSSFCFASISVQ